VTALLFYVVGLVVAVIAGCQFVLVPWLRLAARRRESRAHMPQPEELWVQDDGLLYISAVSAEGVELLTLDAQTKRLHQWMDTWPEWQRRCKLRTIAARQSR